MRKGQPVSEEQKRRQSVLMKGRAPANKGIPMPEEQRALRRGRPSWNKGETSWNKGIPCSEEAKRKQSLAMVGRTSPKLGQVQSLTNRSNSTYDNWRWKVLTRDNRTCRHCDITEEQLAQLPRVSKYSSNHKLECHHIKPWDEYPELRFDVNNGLTLCGSCHSKEERRLQLLKEVERC
jgi:hypothetical protein